MWDSIKPRLRPGDRVEHVEHGAAIVMRVGRLGTGWAVWIRLTDGTIGTASVYALRRAP